MTTTLAQSYAPRANSLAARVITFFQRADADEELHIDDIVIKFETPRESIHAALKDAVALDVLKRNNSLYASGPNILATAAPAAQAPVPLPVLFKATHQPAPATGQPKAYSARHHIDFDSLTVETGQPYTGQSQIGLSKYAPLFARLTKPGDSVRLPSTMRGAVAAAAQKRNKAKDGTFKVGHISATECRVWRIA